MAEVLRSRGNGSPSFGCASLCWFTWVGLSHLIGKGWSHTPLREYPSPQKPHLFGARCIGVFSNMIQPWASTAMVIAGQGWSERLLMTHSQGAARKLLQRTAMQDPNARKGLMIEKNHRVSTAVEQKSPPSTPITRSHACAGSRRGK